MYTSHSVPLLECQPVQRFFLLSPRKLRKTNNSQANFHSDTIFAFLFFAIFLENTQMEFSHFRLFLSFVQLWWIFFGISFQPVDSIVWPPWSVVYYFGFSSTKLEYNWTFSQANWVFQTMVVGGVGAARGEIVNDVTLRIKIFQTSMWWTRHFFLVRHHHCFCCRLLLLSHCPSWVFLDYDFYESVTIPSIVLKIDCAIVSNWIVNVNCSFLGNHYRLSSRSTGDHLAFQLISLVLDTNENYHCFVFSSFVSSSMEVWIAGTSQESRQTGSQIPLSTLTKGSVHSLPPSKIHKKTIYVKLSQWKG